MESNRSAQKRGYRYSIILFLFFALMPGFIFSIQAKTILKEKLIKLVIEPTEKVTLSPAIAGHVIEILVRQGDKVTEGMVLLKMDSSEEKLEIQRLKRVIEKKRYDHTSLSRLLKDDMTSREEVLQAKMQLELALIELKKAELRLEKKVIRSPLNGVVVKLAVSRGQWIGQGQGVIGIINYAKLYALALMNRAEVENLETGNKLKIIFDKKFADKKFADKNYADKKHIGEKHAGEKNIFENTGLGNIIFIDPSYDPVTGLKPVKLEIENPDLKIKPGIEAYINIEAYIDAE